jgi:hypothetical protein
VGRVGWELISPPIQGIDKFLHGQIGCRDETPKGTSGYFRMIRDGQSRPVTRFREDDMTAPLAGYRPTKLLEYSDYVRWREKWNRGH